MSDKNPLNGKYQSFDDEEINEVEAVENTISQNLMSVTAQ